MLDPKSAPDDTGADSDVDGSGVRAGDATEDLRGDDVTPWSTDDRSGGPDDVGSDSEI